MRAKILIVDDEELFLDSLGEALSNNEYKIFKASRGKDAIDGFKKLKPDVVILDVRLPDANGFEILGWLRQHPDFGKLPIVMVTAETEAEDVLQGLRGGADGYIFKPFQAEALIQCIRKVLNIS